MKNIQRVSFFLKLFFQLAFVVLPIMQITIWLFAPTLQVNHADLLGFIIPASVEIAHPLVASDLALGFAISLFPTAVIIGILYFLIKLFKHYEQGEIFSLANARCYRNIGVLMLIGQLVNFIVEIAMGVALTWHNPLGQKVASFTFGTYDVVNILTAIMVIVISWIMIEGSKLKDELKYTV